MKPILTSSFLYLILLLLGECWKDAYAQTRNPAQDINRANIWHFGQTSVPGARDAPSLHFDNGSPIVMTNGNPNAPGASTLSDTTGNLFLYGGGFKLYNHLHNEMQNAGFTGDSGWIGISQANLVIPKPNNPDIVYYFSASVTLKYSVVDMGMNNGIGAVIERNVELHPFPVGVKLGAIHHCNGNDVWVVGHEWESDKFFAYLLTETGIETTPVISQTGPVDNTPGYWQAGIIKFSPNGKKLAIAFGGSVIPPYLFDFDNSTGIVFMPIALDVEQGDNSANGLSFSPDNNQLYVSTHNGRLLQYYLNAGNATEIAQSRKVIYDALSENKAFSFGAMQIGLDGKIYMTKHGTPGKDYLGVINHPNLHDTHCDFNPSGVYLNGSFGAKGLMNTIESYFYTGTSAYPCYGDTTTSVGIFAQGKQNNIILYPNPFNDFALIEISGDKSFTENISFRLFDVLGREHEAKVTLRSKSVHHAQYQLHRGQLNHGYYFLTIKTSNNTQTIKLSIF